MEPLYKTETYYTFEEHKKWNKVFRSRVSKYNLRIGICYLLLGLLSGLSFCLSKYEISYGILLAIPIAAVINLVQVKFSVKRTWKTNQIAHNKKVHFLFYDNYFEVITHQGNSKFFYNEIYKILETNTNVYILPNNNQGFIVIKDNCPLEFLDFIKKIKLKYKK